MSKDENGPLSPKIQTEKKPSARLQEIPRDVISFGK